jgi:hypothetical protein
MIVGYPKRQPLPCIRSEPSARLARAFGLTFPAIGLFGSQAGSAPLKAAAGGSGRWRVYRQVNAPVALRVRLDLSDGHFQRHLCSQNIGQVQRGVGAAHFRKEGGTRTLIQPSARISAVPIERAYGFGYYRIIAIPVTDVVHSTPLTYPWMPSTEKLRRNPKSSDLWRPRSDT